jgi:hypothetical protein
MQVMANHTPENIADAVTRLRTAYETGLAEFEEINAEPQVLKATA